jgi:predicted phosphoribosyltransferase
MLDALVDETVCAVTPEPFLAVGAGYEDFAASSDEEVHALLRQAADTAGPSSPVASR